jgi:hypothetical protein
MHASRITLIVVIALGATSVDELVTAAPVVPGTGMHLANVGDDFEDPNWQFYPNLPKSSEEQDERVRQPLGRSNNGRWYEGMKRGCPDTVRRVPTPQGGLPGSEFSLLMSSVHTGIPQRPSYQMQQDDFIANVWQRVGGKIPVQHTPSAVVRVFMPPIKTWENRTGPTFGFRLSLETHTWKVPDKDKKSRLFSSQSKKFVLEPYWPGMFVEFASDTNRNVPYDTAFWRIRGNTRGAEVRGPAIETTGWWTLGMSVTPDGMVHYYIGQGIEDLTPEDYVTSQFPYGYRAETFKTFFFNVCNRDDMQTKSTDWIVDDPAVYVATAPRDVARQQRTQR